MSLEAESKDHERELQTDNEEIILLLKAVLVGIAQVTGTMTPKELIALAEDL